MNIYKMKNVTCLLNGECLWCPGDCKYHPGGYVHPIFKKLMADELERELERMIFVELGLLPRETGAYTQTKRKRPPETPAK